MINDIIDNILNSNEINEWIQECEYFFLKEEERLTNMKLLINQKNNLNSKIYELDKQNEKLLEFYKKNEKEEMLSKLLEQEIKLTNWIEEINVFEKELKALNEQKISEDLRGKERNLWKLILSKFLFWNDKNYKKYDQKIIDFNNFNKFQKEIEKNINNLEEDKNKISILSDTIKTFCNDVKRDTEFLKNEKIIIINNDNKKNNSKTNDLSGDSDKQQYIKPEEFGELVM